MDFTLSKKHEMARQLFKDFAENEQSKYFGNNTIVLGYSLANHLGVSVGDCVNLLMLSGSSDVELFSEDRIFIVSGIFSCGYQEINSGYAFLSINKATDYFGKESKKSYGLKRNLFCSSLW